MEKVEKLDKYKHSLKIVGNKVYSYSTHVADITGDNIEVLHGCYTISKTTRKHINYVSQVKNLRVWKK